MRRSTAPQVSVAPSLAIMGRTTMRRRQPSQTGGRANFYIDDCGEFGGSGLEIGTVKLTGNSRLVRVWRSLFPSRREAAGMSKHDRRQFAKAKRPKTKLGL